MRVVWLVALVGAALGIALAADPAETPQKDVVVHEWGVISVHNDVELANADMRAAWADLPKFVYGNVDQRRSPEQLRVVYVPVIYFHSAKEQKVHVKVDFPGGRPAVWWPANSNIDQYSRNLIGKDQPGTYHKHLEWRLVLQPNAKVPDLRTLPKGHWMEACRAVRATDVCASDDFHEQQRERFAYYDGMIPGPKAAELQVAPDRVTLKNRAKHALLDVTVVDRRHPEQVRVARAASLAAGATIDALEFQAYPPERWLASALEQLVKQLSEAGLNEDEAKAMAQVWQREFFETEGLTLFYRLPQAEFDRLLPLTITPRPEKVARVLLVHHPHCEPDLGDRVMALVKQLDSSSFQDRLDAQRRIQALGRAAFVHLVRARNAKPSLEVTARLNKLLEEFEAERAFKPSPPRE